jgi:tRNA(His) 5'-end guanylyltransferase
MTSNLGDRMKRYELPFNHYLVPKTPVIVRVDGKAFHTYTQLRNLNKPFDNMLIAAMIQTTKHTARKMQGFKLAYIQSDEASFLLTDFDTFETEGYFDYELNKILSITASTFTAYFNQFMGVDEVAMFDARAFNIPLEDFPNYFVWRQRDWERNSLQMLARTHYSQKELHGKGSPEIHEMLHKKDVNWAELKDVYKNGTFIAYNSEDPIHEKLSYNDIYELVVPSLYNNGDKNE